MIQTDIQAIVSAVNQHSAWTFVVVFWAAAILSLASCTIVRIPVVVGLIGGAADSKKKAFLVTMSFVAALILSYTLLGVLLGMIATLGSRMMGLSRYFYYFAGFAVLFIGVQMAGLIRIKTLEALAERAFSARHGGVAGAFMFGLIFVLFEAPTCPVCGPFLVVIASLGIIREDFFYAVMLFFTYALGQSLPIIMAGVFSGIVKYMHPKVEVVERVAPVIGGNILVALGILLFILG
ncbi:MAG: cytochrome c biogenesis protein CcdA [Candidatus Omnitrophica bacterium]|nr:cytochrome c biogenesis protein CcdA [Candidatus Omnitrophota bacterium]MDD5736926.1 cytochrome c biogenesis protein CcdA [Candidatus Omnitrophota bacterium]